MVEVVTIEKAELIRLIDMSISGAIVFKNGKEQERLVGAVSRDAISKVIDKYV